MSAHFWRTLHLVLMIVWVVMIPISWIWMRDNLFLVIFVSLYANFATHFSGWQGARAEEASS
jgi:hypothetical protein